MTRSQGSPALPFKWLGALTIAVLLVHIALLESSTMTLRLGQPQPGQAFSTRSIEAAPTANNAIQRAIAPPKKASPPEPANPNRPDLAAPLTGLDSTTPQSAAAAPAEVPTPQPSPTPAATATAAIQNERPPDAPASEAPASDQALAVIAYTVPSSMRFVYKVETNKFPYTLNSELLWQQNGKTYDARLEYSAFGLSRVQTSRGEVTSEGLAPTRFSDKYRSEVAAHFSREQGKVTFSANTPDVALQAGAQDRLSVIIQLGTMLAGDPSRFPPNTTVAIQTIGPRDAGIWVFSVLGDEKISLPGGELSAVKLIRNPRQEFDQKVELWLAPSLGYLPARIRITEANGDFIDQKLLNFQPQT